MTTAKKTEGSVSALCKRLLGALLLAGLSLPAAAAPIVYMTGTGNPWGLSSGPGSNEYAMDAAFGSGNWTKYQGFTMSAFAPDTKFLFLEGGDSQANQFSSFLTTNQTAIQNFVSGGGAIFLNAAPNQGGSFSMGFGVTLTYPDFGGAHSATATAAGIGTGIFTGIANSYSGTSFSHAHVSDGAAFTSLMNDGSGDSVLGAMNFGSGFATFGGLTLPVFHNPDPDSDILRARILGYVAGQANDVPEPGTLFLLGAGMLAGALRRRSS